MFEDIDARRDPPDVSTDSPGRVLVYAIWSRSSAFEVSVGDEHPKFGLGVVTAVEPRPRKIVFESGARKLVVGA